MEEADIRNAWAGTALGAAGLAAPDELYRDWIAPERLEGRGLSDEMMRMWACALTWLGLARIVGEGNETGDAELERAYQISHAMSDVINVLTRHGAWHLTWNGVHRLDPLPKKGDVVIIGPGGYHCRACIVSDVGPSGEVDIVEGGHMTGNGDPRGAGHMSIDRISTKLFVLDGILYCGATAGGSTRVYGWGDCTKMPQPNLRRVDDKAAPIAADETGQAEGG